MTSAWFPSLSDKKKKITGVMLSMSLKCLRKKRYLFSLMPPAFDGPFASHGRHGSGGRLDVGRGLVESDFSGWFEEATP
jgi:hypothetical protein